MRKSKPLKKHSELLSKSLWSIQDVFWLLLGDLGFHNVIAIFQKENSIYNETSKKVLQAGEGGKFGSLLNND